MAVIYGNPKNEKERSTPVYPKEKARKRILEEAGWVVVERLGDEAPATPEADDVPGAPPRALVAENMGVDLPPRVIDRLTKAGYDKPDAVRAASDEDLLAIKGIGEQVLADIREALGPGEPGEEDEAE